MIPDVDPLLAVALGAGLLYAILPLIRWTAAVVAIGAGVLLVARWAGVF